MAAEAVAAVSATAAAPPVVRQLPLDFASVAIQRTIRWVHMSALVAGGTIPPTTTTMRRNEE
jgi:hypothetical protein